MDANLVTSFYLGENPDARRQFNEAVAPLVERAHEDPAFKAEFIANPQEVLARETGSEFVSSVNAEKTTVYVVDKSDPYGIYITIPVDENSLELSDEELEAIAGGIGLNSGCPLIKLNIKCKDKKKLE